MLVTALTATLPLLSETNALLAVKLLVTIVDAPPVIFALLPAGPVGPVAPVAPVAPVGPLGPVEPVAPVENFSISVYGRNINNEYSSFATGSYELEKVVQIPAPIYGLNTGVGNLKYPFTIHRFKVISSAFI